MGGYYADPDLECQAFQICVKTRRGRLEKISFLCPNGSLFDQQYFICDFWFNVDCSLAQSLYYLNDEIAEQRESNNGAGFIPAVDLSLSLGQSAQLRGLNDGVFFQGRGISVTNRASPAGQISFDTLFPTPRPVREIQVSERRSIDERLGEGRDTTDDFDFVVVNGEVKSEKDLHLVDTFSYGDYQSLDSRLDYEDYMVLPTNDKRVDIMVDDDQPLDVNIFNEIASNDNKKQKTVVNNEGYDSDVIKDIDNHVNNKSSSDNFVESRSLGIFDDNKAKINSRTSDEEFYQYFTQFVSDDDNKQNDKVTNDISFHEIFPIIQKEEKQDSSPILKTNSLSEKRHHEFNYDKKSEKEKDIIHRTLVAGLNFGKK